MDITISEALSLKSVLTKRMEELKGERTKVSKTQFIENEDSPDVPVRTLPIVEEDLYAVHRDYLELNEKIMLANLNNTFAAPDFGFTAINIATALELAKLLRNELYVLKQMATEKKVSYEPLLNSYSREAKKLKTVTNFDPNEYRNRGIDLERKVNRLSAEIEKANYQFTITFNPASNYM